MGELENLAERGSSQEVLQKGVDLIANPATFGGAIHFISQLSKLKRHSEAVELAQRLFDQRGSSRDLNILLKTVLASGDTPTLNQVLQTITQYVEGSGYQYDVHLITTWLKALLKIDKATEFWRVYNAYAKEQDRTENEFLIAQYYQMLIREGKYAFVVEHFSQLRPPTSKDDLLKKLYGRALLELGRVEEARQTLLDTRNDYLRRSLEGKIAQAEAARGVEGGESPTEAEQSPLKIVQIRENRVFVVHGHDRSFLTELENLLRRIGAEPWFFDRLPKEGSQTVIEVLERFIPQADAVIVLLTPDDEGRKIGTNVKLEPRARQNVLIEAGYAVISKRGRSLLVALSGVSIPSDFAGILRVQGPSWTPEKAVEVAKRLKEMGLAVDPMQAI